MIKKIQSETGCRVQFQQARDEGPGDRRCFLSGNPQQIDHVCDVILKKNNLRFLILLF